MRIALASDHAGFRYKSLLAAWLRAEGHDLQDFGAHDDVSSDYPDFVMPAARAVARGECERGIVLGGSGNGEAIAANRVEGVRCALCWDEETARLGRAHNDANVISLGERLVSAERAMRIVAVWLATPFDGGRHARRIAKLDLGGPAAAEVRTVSLAVSRSVKEVRGALEAGREPGSGLAGDASVQVRPHGDGSLVLVTIVASPGQAPGQFEDAAREAARRLESLRRALDA
jgi:ribose 5-phosphate isomerase B